MNWFALYFDMFLQFLPWIAIALMYVWLPKYLKFRKSSYQKVSGNKFLNTVLNKGNYGEFLTFIALEKISGYTKILTNLYLPRKNGTTTEVDLIMIAETGIYVFESKNYSGWIFGDEKSKNWTQSMPNKSKNKFFNPIMQNEVHINALKESLVDYPVVTYKSMIVFSERCTLKKISKTSPHVLVIKRDELKSTVTKDLTVAAKILSVTQIDSISQTLSKYGLASDEMKQAHITAIQKVTNK